MITNFRGPIAGNLVSVNRWKAPTLRYLGVFTSLTTFSIRTNTLIIKEETWCGCKLWEKTCR
ncbi:hypothetical protein PT2222_290087 [Paraburkholderia tropica]